MSQGSRICNGPSSVVLSEIASSCIDQHDDCKVHKVGINNTALTSDRLECMIPPHYCHHCKSAYTPYSMSSKHTRTIKCVNLALFK